ncbi:thioredoxin family protein [Rhizobium sp. Leaf341]|uniref:thioredoxin family protein n=1 Tax=Rhizobium sp. Leaf341 TaxID=1736344 RepID=UPI0007124951|nr:thioredoxin family protein [Rhizobium sp. Leaf341]KQR69955.1 hypothetical protein ASG03_04660 [Rhizobium sp. Leaf341]
MSETAPTIEATLPVYHEGTQAQAAIAAAEKPVLLQFSADWCGPCKRMSPVVDKVIASFEEKLDFFRLNVDENQALSQSLAVKGIPHFILMKDGAVFDRWAGAQPESEFVARVARNV